jgi:hypothetical protein
MRQNALVMTVFALSAWAALAVAHAPERGTKRDQPSDAEIAEKRKLIEDLYADSLRNRTAEARRVLAQRMLNDGVAITDDAASRFALIEYAGQVAAEGRDVLNALAAVASLDADFVIDRAGREAGVLSRIGREATDIESCRGVATSAPETLDRLLAAGRVDEAMQLADVAEACALRSREPGLAAGIKVIRQRWAAATEEAKRVGDLRKRLQEAPSDPAANRDLGTYLCFDRGDWTNGLPHLAKGDGELASVAKADLAGPSDGREQSKLADRWASVAGTLEGDRRGACLTRAREWYAKAAQRLTGLERLQAEKRRDSIVFGAGPSTRPQPAEQAVPGQPDRVVFVCDGTGTMVGQRYQQLKAALKARIERLPAGTQFAVILYQDERFEGVGTQKMLLAGVSGNREVMNFLESVSIRGQTNPIPAIQAAFKLRPTTVYFYSDAEFDNLVKYDQVIAAFRRANADGRAVVHCIMLGDRDKAAEATLKRIADDHKGFFDYLTERDGEGPRVFHP